MFKDRFDAAHQLIPYLKKYSDNPDAIILAIPRGGLQLGSVLAHALKLPLGYPGNPEYAIGAISMDHIYISPNFIHENWIHEYVQEQAIKIRKLLQERAHMYRGKTQNLNLTDKIVIVVDDGVATGQTLLASLALIQEAHPKKIIVALPVAPPQAIKILQEKADEVICLDIPDVFFGVGQFYQKFEQVDDSEAIRLLHEANT